MKKKDHKESRFLKKIKDISLQQTDRKACFSGPRTDSCMMEFLEALERYSFKRYPSASVCESSLASAKC